MDDFLVRALIAGCGVAAIAGPLGSFLIWRRMAFFGDTLAHSALLGVAAGTALGIGGNAGIVAVCLGVAVLLVTLGRDRRLAGDTVLGILSHGALALGLVALAFIERGKVDLQALLFGDILSVTSSDIAWIYGGGAAVAAALAWLWRPLLAATVDEELATVEGVPVGAVGFAYMIMLAAVVALSMKVVGVLLVGALIVIPVMVSLRLATGLRAAIALAIIVGVFSSLLGLGIAFYANVAAGGSVVLTAVGLLIITLAGSSFAAWLSRSRLNSR
ncbi:MAG: metal ABC transporter permease, partial [Proteobacteria bacterium]|nr:metal ABC transporter permease [Pseudomonadota bacterium]